jgi:hypothetical protein
MVRKPRGTKTKDRNSKKKLLDKTSRAVDTLVTKKFYKGLLDSNNNHHNTRK